uniref:Uncharacterized protein n=2 Tax=Daucus carota subsp. sativus TaxID=79200 RepID=A0A161XYN6_DAUCS
MGAATFSVGMVIRDHKGSFVEGRSMTLPRPVTVFEAECIGVRDYCGGNRLLANIQSSS